MKKIMMSGLSVLFFAHCIGQTSPAENGKIEVVINNFRNNKGVVRVILFNKQAGFPAQEKSFKILDKTIVNKSSSAEFDNLPPGEYAISVYHDENNNKELDTNFLGVPKEGVGASNNAKGHFGPPKYTDAKFILNNDVKTINISMRYL